MNETLRQIRALYAEGPTAGLTDAALLQRFAEGRDSAAFEALVARHGPMVLGTCRGVLRNPTDAEDAFQATFLALARSGRSIRAGDSLGGWLHRVARRVAGRANARAGRRRAHEASGVDPDRVPAPPPDLSRSGRPEGLHEEIDRLPESLRRPLILCALEGLTHAEAAGRLGCGEATLRRRLAAARESLRVRLGRRGLALPAGFGEAGQAALPSVPPAWVTATARVAVLATSGGSIPGPVAALAGSIPAVRWARRVVVGLIGVGIATGALGAWAARPGREVSPPPVGAPPTMAQAPSDPPKATPAPAKPRSEDSTDFPGVVLDPSGRPVVGAQVFAHPRDGGIGLQSATSDPAGRFQFTFDVQQHRRNGYLADDRVDGRPWPEFSNVVEEWPALVAVAPGFGFAVGALGPDGSTVARLVEDVPIEGRVIDRDGRAVAGVSVRVRAILAPTTGDLSPWLDAARLAVDRSDYGRTAKPRLSILARHRDGLAHAYPALRLATTTDAEGRFRIDGVGRERVAWVAIERPGIESALIAVATRPNLAPFVVPSTTPDERKHLANPSADLPVVGPRFDHVASPGRAVDGTVVEAGTGAPITGVTVTVDYHSMVEWADDGPAQAQTDATGHYRIDGLPEGIKRRVSAQVGENRPFIAIERPLATGRDPAPAVRADFALRRGVWATGRVLDGSTSRPIASARVRVATFRDNPHLPKAPDALAHVPAAWTDQSGRYRVAVLPGRGLLSVWAGQGDFGRGIGANRIPGQVVEYGQNAYPTVPDRVVPENINLVAEVNPPEDAESITLDLTLEKGRSRPGRVVGPDGPIVGQVRVAGHNADGWMKEVDAGEVRADNLAPGEVRRVVVRLDGRQWIGVATLQPGDNGPFEVRLGPWATLDGRIVGPDGQPQSRGLTVALRDDDRLPRYLPGLEKASGWPSERPVTPDGRFHFDGLIPGEAYTVEVFRGQSALKNAAKGLTLQPGEAKNLGAVTLSP